MKKILVTLAIFAIVGSTLFAQNTKVDASNEIYSETVYKEANGDDTMEWVKRGFWGFRETAEGKVTTETWTLQARLRAWLWSLGKIDNEAFPGTGSLGENESVHGDNWENVFFNDKGKTDVRVNFWYRPLAGIEMGIGNDFAGYYQMPASNMLGIDKQMGYMINYQTDGKTNFAPRDDRIFNGSNGNGARWASNGFALNVTKVPNLLFSINIPFSAFVDEYDFAPAVNLAAHYTIRDNINIGVAYHGGINRQDGHVLGTYLQFSNGTVRIPLGVTVGFKARKEQTSWVDNVDKGRIEIDFAPDFTLRNGMKIGLSLSWAMAFGGKLDIDDKDSRQTYGFDETNPDLDLILGANTRRVMPLVIGLYFKMPINNAWTFDMRTWFELALGTGDKFDNKVVRDLAALGGDATKGYAKGYYFNALRGTAGQWYFEPKVSYKINAHNEVFAGFKLRFNFVMGDKEDTRNNYMGYAVPIGWKWTL